MRSTNLHFYLLACLLPYLWVNVVVWCGVVLSGYIPAPMYFGALIDSTCRLWETDAGDLSSASPTCQRDGGGTGSCLLYDTDHLRWRTYGVALAVQFLQLTFGVLLYFAIRGRNLGAAADQLPPKTVQTPDADGDAKPRSTAAEELALIETDAAHTS